MKNGMRWGLLIFVVAGIFLIFYYLGFPFWPPYFYGGWGYRFLGPRMWPVFPFFGLLVLIVLGFILVRILSPASRRPSPPPGEGWTFCPHCGADLLRRGKPEEVEGGKDVPMPRSWSRYYSLLF